MFITRVLMAGVLAAGLSTPANAQDVFRFSVSGKTKLACVANTSQGVSYILVYVPHAKIVRIDPSCAYVKTVNRYRSVIQYTN